MSMKRLSVICVIIPLVLAGCTTVKTVEKAETVCPQLNQIPPTLSVSPEPTFTESLKEVWQLQTNVTN